MPPKKNSKKTAPIKARSEASGIIDEYPLADLLLDKDNPRFADRHESKDQSRILEYIYGQFDLKDVLSSIAVNGFFHSEPIIGVKANGNKIKIVEGNRRLAACMIITGDERARSLKKVTSRYSEIWQENGKKKIVPVPVSVFPKSSADEFAAYLGVRHIQGSRQWDSYAKAAWIADMVESSRFEIDEIAAMIGDTQRLARRLLFGYYTAKQLEDAGKFDPQISLKRGRGSCVHYPFSWVYTILGYERIRTWLELPDTPDPGALSKKSLPKAELLFVTMFGQGSKEPAIRESRQLADLAKAITSPDGPRLLRKGNSLEEIEHLVKPPIEKVEDGLTEAELGLNQSLAPLNAGELDETEAYDLLPLSKRVLGLARSVDKQVRAVGNDDE